MAGRAGRAGLDTVGEAVVFARDQKRLEALQELINSKPKMLTSCLYSEGNNAEARNQVKRVVLEAVTSGLVRSKDDMKRYVSSTLMATLQKDSFDNVVRVTKEALGDLQKEKFIVWKDDVCTQQSTRRCAERSGCTLTCSVRHQIVCALRLHSPPALGRAQPTDADASIPPPPSSAAAQLWVAHPLGKGSSASGLSPKDAAVLHEDLRRARDQLILNGDLHLLFLVAPETIQTAKNTCVKALSERLAAAAELSLLRLLCHARSPPGSSLRVGISAALSGRMEATPLGHSPFLSPLALFPPAATRSGKWSVGSRSRRARCSS